LSKGGEHRIDNGLLLRSDVHTLFDDGEEFYVRAGARRVELPRRRVDQPNQEFLEWHMDEVFKAS